MSQSFSQFGMTTLSFQSIRILSISFESCDETYFYGSDGGGKQAAKEKKFLYDDQFLYLLFLCFCNQLKQNQAQTHEIS